MNLAFVYRLQQLLFMYGLFAVYAAFQANKVVYIYNKRQFIRRRNMYVKSLPGRRTAYDTRIKFESSYKISLQKLLSLKTSFECRECWFRSIVGRQTVPRRRTSDAECYKTMSVIWYEGRRGLHGPQSGEQHE